MLGADMKHQSRIWNGLIMGLVISVMVWPLGAVEIITKQDIINNVVKTNQLVKVADNAIFLLDTSSSTNSDFGDTDKPVVQVMKNELKSRNAYLPDLGYEMGIYIYTDWQELYPVQLYNREKVDAALNKIPDRGRGITPLNTGLKKLEGVLKPLKGRTAVFVFWDGDYTGDNPADTARRLAKEYDVCFYVISSARPSREATLTQDVASLNACSRVIPLASFFNQPNFMSGALFDVKATEHVVTTTDTKIVGAKVDNINFAFNETELAAKDKAELDKLAQFMNDRPKSYVVIAGYTDNVGTRDHNEGLSRGRAEMVARYLKEKHSIGDSRMVLFWYGPNNPLVPNDTPANQAKNRRVEVNVGLGEG
jgi:OOP family OmpA-OmpF porin